MRLRLAQFALLVAGSRAKCVDTLSQCAAWAAHGECESNAAYMEHACAKSCGKCGGADGTNATPTTPRPAAGRLQHPAAAAMVEAAAAELAKEGEQAEQRVRNAGTPPTSRDSSRRRAKKAS